MKVISYLPDIPASVKNMDYAIFTSAENINLLPVSHLEDENFYTISSLCDESCIINACVIALLLDGIWFHLILWEK